ncbi:MAG: SHOCT domain-containing protein [Deltaproteobacteria bacterium]|nr:SHOCT domain-containing protein [Deltaproteobacteria bacterium]
MKRLYCSNFDWLGSVVLGVLTFIMFSSNAYASDVRQLWQSRDQFVALERQDSLPSGSATLNDHPVEIFPDRLTAILASIELQSPDSKAPERLFTLQSLEVLVPEMVQGFKKAALGEDLTFAVIGLHKSLFGLAKSPKVTTGRAFYKEGRLNIIIGFAQKDFNEREDRRLSPFTPGNRQKALDVEWTLLPQPGQNGFALVRKDWVTFSDEWRAAVAQAPVVEKVAPPSQSAPVAEQNAPAVQAAPAQQVKQTDDTRKPAERLTTLNELKEKGLISEEEYRSKRLEILNRL